MGEFMTDGAVKLVVAIVAISLFLGGGVFGFAWGQADAKQNYLQAEMDDKPGQNMVTITIPQDNLHKVDIDTQ
jgi:uncharacterized protein HemX